MAVNVTGLKKTQEPPCSSRQGVTCPDKKDTLNIQFTKHPEPGKNAVFPNALAYGSEHKMTCWNEHPPYACGLYLESYLDSEWLKLSPQGSLS